VTIICETCGGKAQFLLRRLRSSADNPTQQQTIKSPFSSFFHSLQRFLSEMFQVHCVCALLPFVQSVYKQIVAADCHTLSEFKNKNLVINIIN
jgi:hypothetical protein